MKRKLDLFDYIYIIIGTPWLFLMLFTSRMYTEVKIALLAILMTVCFSEITIKKINFPRKETGFIIFFMIFCLLSLLWGCIQGYEFEISIDYALVQYYFITPLCILLFSMVFGRDGRRKAVLWDLLKYLTCMLTVLDVIRIVLYVQGIDPPYLQFLMMASQGMEETLTLRISNEIALMFLLPVYVFMVMNPNGLSKKDNVIYIITVVFGIIYSILSGRKMLEIEVAIAFIFSITFCYGRLSLTKIKKALNAKTFILFLVVAVLFGIVEEKLSSIIGIESVTDLAYDTISNGLSRGDNGVEVRVNSSNALFNLWSQSPLWGNGLNSYSELHIANKDTQWSYEIFYHAWLAQTGLIGTVILFIPIMYVIKSLRRVWMITRDNAYGALLIGFVCFAIGGASNPLLYLVWPWSIVLIYCRKARVSKEMWSAL